MEQKETKEIVLCDKCKATGIMTVESCDFSRTIPTYNFKKAACNVCDGTGRLYKVTTYEKLRSEDDS